MSNDLLEQAKKCALYDFDTIEMVECKWALWQDIINALSPAATPMRDALADMIDVYDGIATALDDSGRGWNGFRGAHLERIGTTVRKARAILRPEPAATAGWQPMETAPNDEPVLVSAWLNNEPGVERFTDVARRVFGEWVDEHDGDPIWTPTHWMPLPDAPVSRPQHSPAGD